MKRIIEQEFIEWKEADNRKPLLLRGARQIGKTYSVRKFKNCFDNYLEINFEEDKRVKALFNDSLNPIVLCDRLSAFYQTDIIPGRTLLFFDEIQSCIPAISSLRFFYEKMPDLHIIAAGSLLEFALEELPSMGVGRITSLFMYPLSFYEFLMARGEDKLIAMIENATVSGNEIIDVFHQKLLDHYKTFQIIGGMPEVVKSYVHKKSLNKCFKILDDLLLTFRDDFAKYKNKASVRRITEVFNSVSFQAGGKFKYSKINSEDSSNVLKASFELLEKAGLIYKITHTSANGLPLGAEINPKKFKAIPFDTGIHQRILGLNIADYISVSKFESVNKGSMAEIFVGLEILKYSASNRSNMLYYWHRESKSSNAEVDYVIQQNHNIIPIEVKSGATGRLRSLHLFMSTHNSPKGYKISLDNYSKYEKIYSTPLYSIATLITS
jgi:uncharacterized protein